MARVKRGNIARKRRKKILEITKGFRGSSSRLYRTAQQKTLKALTNSYIGRKLKKREFAKIWITRLNAGVRYFGLNYSNFQNQLKISKILLNKKVCSQLALYDAIFFKKLVYFIKK